MRTRTPSKTSTSYRPFPVMLALSLLAGTVIGSLVEAMGLVPYGYATTVQV